VKIPIANVYYLLCYAWQHVQQTDVVDLRELEGIEHVHDLLGKVLAEGTFGLVRRGLDRGYREVREDLAGIRGKLDIGETAKRALRSRGRACCAFGELSYDVPHNRILKSTLLALLRLSDLDAKVRQEVRTAFQKLEGITVVRVDRRTFRQVQLDRNRHLYRFLLEACLLVH
jgi:5-methylcytosine-specific restriction enzyme subunit McrC